MFNKALIIGTFNPLHKGHEYLLSKAQEYSKSIDIYIGNKKKPHRLPRNIREKTVNEFIGNNNWESKIQTINFGKHLDLDGGKYDLIITGSDLLNIILSGNKKIRARYRDYYFSFSNILSANRKETPLKRRSRNQLDKHANLMEIESPHNISGSKIRQTYREGKDISKMVSETTWKIIKDYIYIFKN